MLSLFSLFEVKTEHVKIVLLSSPNMKDIKEVELNVSALVFKFNNNLVALSFYTSFLKGKQNNLMFGNLLQQLPILYGMTSSKRPDVLQALKKAAIKNFGKHASSKWELFNINISKLDPLYFIAYYRIPNLKTYSLGNQLYIDFDSNGNFDDVYLDDGLGIMPESIL